MNQDSEMSTDPIDEYLNMMILPDDPSTSTTNKFYTHGYDRIVGRQVRKGKVYYEVLPAPQFGFSSSIYEAPSMIAPYNIACFEYKYHNCDESVFPIPGTLPDAQPLSIRWFGTLDDQCYFLIEYDNQTHRLVEMNDPSNTLDPLARQFVCDNLESYLKNYKIDVYGNEWPPDPFNFRSELDLFDPQPGPSTSNSSLDRMLTNKDKVCPCSMPKPLQRSKFKLSPSKLDLLIRRKKPQSANRKKCYHFTNPDSDEEPPKKLGRY